VSLFAEQSREQLRASYREAWRKWREGLPLQPLEAQIAAVVGEHPEYQSLIEAADSHSREFPIEAGDTNPFLHLGMHLALREQVGTDRPPGIAAIHQRLARRLGSAHAAEHAMIEPLATALWEAQRSGRLPDEAAYLERLRRL
jgi:hypothetical protein